MSLPPYQLITTSDAWDRCVAILQQHSQLAIDLESNSMYAYRERVCLIQISVPEHDFIIDPLAGLDLTPFGAMIEDPNVQKIFHAAEYDLILLKREFGWQLQNLFDTMWAVRILGYKKVGLANVLEHHYGIVLDKKYQRSDWCKRPLSPDALVYAQRDTHYLIQLQNDLSKLLDEGGHNEEASESFLQQSDVRLPDTDFSPDDFWSISGARKLGGRELAALKALAIFRNGEAKKRDRPVFKIFNDRTLLAIAELLPYYTDDLRDIPGMSYGQIRRYGRQITRVIRDAETDDIPKRVHTSKRTPDDVMARFEQLHLWRKNRAIKRGVESDVVVSRDALWQMARANPQTIQELTDADILPSWRLAQYGPEIVRLLAEE